MYDSLVAFLNRYEAFKIEIGSHMDYKTKDTSGNHLWSSAKEAIAMKWVLVGLGVDENRITTRGYGNTWRIIDKSEMAKMNEREQCQARFINTRIEITLVSLQK